jgi:hypothetical protein
MGVFVGDGPLAQYAVVSYPMIDRGFRVQIADLGSSEWALQSNGIGGPPPPGPGANHFALRCVSNRCFVYATRDLAALTRGLGGFNAMGAVPPCREVGVFYGSGSPGQANVISYPMADRDGAVQAVIVSSGVTDALLFGVWQRGERGADGSIHWEAPPSGAQTVACPG